MRYLRKPYDMVRSTVANARRHEVPKLSAALAFYAIFSLAPIIVILVTLAGLVLSTEDVEFRIQQEVRSFAGDDAALLAGKILASARKPASNIIAFAASVFFLFFAASRVFAHLNDSMQIIWETKRGGFKSTVRNRLIGGAMVLAAGVAFWASVLAQTALASARAVVGERWGKLEFVLVAGDWLVTIVLSVFCIASIYHYLPRTHVPWRAALAGATITTLLILLGRFFFGLYLRFGVASSLQGAAGSLVVVVLWTYYVSQILFVGAEFARVYKGRMTAAAGEDSTGKKPE